MTAFTAFSTLLFDAPPPMAGKNFRLPTGWVWISCLATQKAGAPRRYSQPSKGRRVALHPSGALLMRAAGRSSTVVTDGRFFRQIRSIPETLDHCPQLPSLA